jgi:ABC-type antimicrobial peptide transport system permease subunit
MQSRASFVEAFSVALQSLRASKLRTFLTLLGIILATTTLIAVMSVIEGMNRYIAEHITSDLGTDSFQIRKIVMIGRGDPKTYLEMQRRNPELSRAEYEFVKSHATLSTEIGLEAFRNCTVHLGQKTLERIELEGGSPNIGLIANMPAANGHFPLEVENDRHMMTVFLGADINSKLFPTGAIALVATAGLTGIATAGTPSENFKFEYDSAYGNNGLSQPYVGPTTTGQSYGTGVAINPSDPGQRVYTLVEANPNVGVGGPRGAFPASGRTIPPSSVPCRSSIRLQLCRTHRSRDPVRLQSLRL